MRLFQIFVAFGLLYLPNAFAIETCSKFTTSLQMLNEIPKKKCAEVRDSKQCQEFYKTLAAKLKESELAKRKLTCEQTAWDILVSTAVPLPLNGSCQDGFADFALEIVHSVVNIGQKLASNIKKNNSIVYKCASDPAGKQSMILATIGMWPKMMQPKSIPANLEKQDCVNIKTWLDQIELSERTKLAKELIPFIRGGKALTDEQQEAALYLNPNLHQKSAKSKSIGEMAASLMAQVSDVAMCYSREYQTQLYCEALATAATFVIPGMQGLRVARLEKLATLAGRELTTVEIDVLAQQALSASKIKGLPGRQGLVDTVSVLNDSDRLSLAGKIVGRQLTDNEVTAILKAHNLPSSELLEKGRILKDAGFNADEREIFMRSSITGQSTQTAKVKSMAEVVQSLPEGSTKFRLLGEIEMGKSIPNVEAATNYFEKATKNLEQTIMTKPKPSPRELGEVQYSASRYGSQVKDPAEIARAQKLIGSAYDKQLTQEMADLEIKTSRSGAMRINAAEEAQAYVKQLRSSVQTNSSVGKKAVDSAGNFQADAIVNYLNKVRKWNLR